MPNLPRERAETWQTGKARKRVVIEGVKPEIDGGRFPIKRTKGERVKVEADIVADGHEIIAASLLYRREQDAEWQAAPMQPLVNDRWQGEFRVQEVGRHLYALEAWVDRFRTWQRDLKKRVDAGQDVAVELLVGAGFIDEAEKRAPKTASRQLREWAKILRGKGKLEEKLDAAQDPELAGLMGLYPDRRFITVYEKNLAVVVDPVQAGCSAWYEMFPRSAGAAAGQHGTFKDCEARLAYIAAMGFDVLYLPPIHPIGVTNRKGKNNNPVAAADDVGSPWAIGAAEGGHKAVHPELGTLEDFRHFVEKARENNLAVALDLAYQGSPDHPYVREHPLWFRWRPDNTVQYAENPPKKYEDIYPFDFETEDWQELWEEFKGIVLFWIEQGVRIFRVDNPHTKPFHFWEWLISEIKKDYPEVFFLAEAFTRPKVMYRLAKLGFGQSYTYFTWRNTKWELTQYLTEITRTEVREYFRPNLWPNTPDILTEYLQFGGRAAFMIRLVLAATLGANYGIYGPAFELWETRPREPGSEEYLDSEKYEIRHWDIQRPDSLKDFIGRVNRVRRENPALQSHWNLNFFPMDNEQLICYAKCSEDLANTILVVVNLDPHHTQGGWLELPLRELGLDPGQPYQVHDLLGEARFLWHGPRNYVELDPKTAPAYIFRLRRRVRTERDFDYYL
ncbi:MAG: alpha-1,4-glucan--maltose-1-phosphate maltosyltransferase [Deltaproteobacteria bacterium RBG_13_60_28]|nr:MAG: alpha-1,4-glucan--maltose-1-phosphate maltosyltransferase [Deltaproteobacteria bacterium RBG_13_60_28]